MYAELTTQNESWLKRFSHGARFRIASDLLELRDNDHVLDYGTGDGHMLTLLRAANEKCKITGYEPMEDMFNELNTKMSELDTHSVALINKLQPSSERFTKICCLEVLEHLTEAGQEKEVSNMIDRLADDGVLVISVPIESGFSSLLKNIARVILRQTHDNTSFSTVTKSVFSVPIERGNGPYIPSHIGFYYKNLEKILQSKGLKIQKKRFSPMGLLKGLANSQVFYVIEK